MNLEICHGDAGQARIQVAEGSDGLCAWMGDRELELFCFFFLECCFGRLKVDHLDIEADFKKPIGARCDLTIQVPFGVDNSGGAALAARFGGKWRK